MSYNIVALPKFRKQIKKLSKKYASLKLDFADFLEDLESNPEQGTYLGKNCYKVRLAIKSKGKGKSGGVRIITNILITDSIIYLLTIYDKSEKENLTDNELTELLKDIPD